VQLHVLSVASSSLICSADTCVSRCCCVVQVIVERYKKEKLLPAMDKSKFLLPEDLSVAQFSSVVRSHSQHSLLLLASLPHTLSAVTVIRESISISHVPGSITDFLRMNVTQFLEMGMAAAHINSRCAAMLLGKWHIDSDDSQSC